MCQGKGRLELQRLLQVPDRRFKLAQRLERQPQLVLRVAIVRIECLRTPQMLEGQRGLPVVQKLDPDIPMRRSTFWKRWTRQYNFGVNPT